MTSKTPDDLDAVRTVIDALQGFDPKSQERIMRWAREKLGLPTTTAGAAPAGAGSALGSAPGAAIGAAPTSGADAGRAMSIKEFIVAKSPQSDNQFAAAVAYYYQFEAPEDQRKPTITSADLQEATRLAGRDRLMNPGKTLSNAHDVGLLDRAGDRGSYSINAVGENLVAMTLPGGATTPRKKGKKKASKSAKKSASAKKSPSKAPTKRTTKAKRSSRK